MQSLTIISCTCLALILFSPAAKAQTLFLPMLLHKTGSHAVYQIDHVRLWHVSENNPAPPSENFCGWQHKVQVHIFDHDGDRSGQSRLNGVIVQVIQNQNGHRTEEFRTTGLPGVDAGMVEFTLYEQAEVRIFADVNGYPVVSQAAFVTTLPSHIDSERLLASGYCQDEASCQLFVNANRCVGQFSWNVVFKRSY